MTETEATERMAIECLRSRFWNFAVRLTGNLADADDLLQEVCVCVLRSPGHLRRTENPWPWVYRIVVSNWKLQLRTQQRCPTTLADLDQIVNNRSDQDESETVFVVNQLISAIGGKSSMRVKTWISCLGDDERAARKLLNCDESDAVSAATLEKEKKKLRQARSRFCATAKELTRKDKDGQRFPLSMTHDCDHFEI